MSGAGHPSGLALTWGVRKGRRSGPKPSFSLEEIGEAAISLADTRGLAEVSMLAVAGRLGCTKMALYRYVASRADLVSVMFDAALGEPPPTVHVAQGWKPRLAAWAGALLARYDAHPWAVDVPLGASALTRSQTLWLEAALEGLRHSPLTLPDRLRLVLLLNAHVVFTVRLRRDAVGGTAAVPDATVTDAMAPELPEVMRVLEAGYLTDGSPNGADFTWGLTCIVNGAELAGDGGPLDVRVSEQAEER